SLYFFSLLNYPSLFLFFSFYSSLPPRALHSFPTRRSSDLCGRTRGCLAPMRRYRESKSTPPSGEIKNLGSSRSGLGGPRRAEIRSEEHTSELQSRSDLVCRLLLEKKKKKKIKHTNKHIS